MRNEKGFTLVSVLMAITMFGVFVMAMTGTATAVAVAQRVAAQRTVAVGIARAYMEEIRAADPQNLASESPVKVNAEGDPDQAGPYVRYVTVENVSHNLKKVAVVVKFPNGRAPVELATMAFVGLSQS